MNANPSPAKFFIYLFLFEVIEYLANFIYLFWECDKKFAFDILIGKIGFILRFGVLRNWRREKIRMYQKNTRGLLPDLG